MKQYIMPKVEIVTLASEHKIAYEMNLSDLWGEEVETQGIVQ